MTGLESGVAAEPFVGETARALPDGVWVRGRVVMPEGVPEDERAEVAARVLSFDDAPGYVAEIGRDGAFAVMFPKDVDSGWIELHARYLVLEPNEAVDLEEPPEEIVLEPVLGGRVRGTIVATGRAEGTFVEISAETAPGARHVASRRVRLGEDLGFDFAGLPPIAKYEIAAQAQGFLRFERAIAVVPGTTTELAIELHPGVRVRGRVFGPDGRPVERAKIWRTSMPPTMELDRAEADTWSGPDGSFAVSAIPPGDVAIGVIASGCLREIVDLGRLEDGSVRDGLEIRLRTGLVRGRVEWPDGAPAPDAVVEIGPEIEYDGTPHDGPPRREWVDEEGRFEIGFASEGPFALFARCPGRLGTDPIGGSPARRSGLARIEGVRPGPDPVVLVLEAGQLVQGRVVDDRGEPIESCTVRGTLDSGSRVDFLGAGVSGRFEDDRGAFAFAGLARGLWHFTASVDGRSGSTDVDLPNGAAAIELVVPRGADVRGTVVDPDGRPVSGARVQSPSPSVAISGADGSFEILQLGPGSVVLRAEAASFAPSEPVYVSIEPGRSASDVQLVLQRGGAIECEVLDAGGDPESRRHVEIRGPWGGGEEVADGEGRLTIEELVPGAYTLSKVPSHQENAGEGKPGPSLWTRLQASRTRVSVDVAAGATTRVVLGGPRGPSIRVRGRVIDAGAPLPGIDVDATETDAQGRFEFVVEEPGDVEIQVGPRKDGMEWTTSRRIVGSSDEVLDLILPSGTISGVARTKEDRLLQGARVAAWSEPGGRAPGAWIAHGTVTTDAAGRFSFRNLPAGRCVITSLAEGGIPLRTEVVLGEAARIDDLVLRFP